METDDKVCPECGIKESEHGKFDKKIAEKFLNDLAGLYRQAQEDNITEFAMIGTTTVLGNLLNQGYGTIDVLEFMFRLMGNTMYGVDEADGIEIMAEASLSRKH